MSQRFTKSRSTVLLLAGLILLAGCSSPPRLLEGSGAWNTPDEMPVPARVQREYDAALKALENGDEVEATQRLEVFMVENPRWPGAYVNLAILYHKQGRTEDALNTLDMGLAVAPEFAPAWNQMGLIKRQNGDFQGAEQAWLTATQVNPDYAYGWYNLGVLYELYLQDLGKAMDNFLRYRELVAAHGGDEKVDKWIADLGRRTGRPDQQAKAAEL